jgi:hypothetical protein
MAKDSSIGFNFFGRDVSVGKTLAALSREADHAGSSFKRIGETAAGVFTGNLMTSALAGAKDLFQTFAVDGVKSAMEDQAAQQRLATTLQNTTGASKLQTAAVEDYITKLTLSTGVSDDKLRPSLDRLVRSTHNVSEAQKLQSLAMDISAGTGKDLQAVSEALAKAHDGNFGALKKLGVSLDNNIIKHKDLKGAVKAMTETFGGQSAKQIDTFQGRMQRLSTTFDEAKETVGYYVLEALQPLSDFAVNKLGPALGDLAENIGPKLKPVFEALTSFAKSSLLPAMMKIWEIFSKNIGPVFKTVSGILTQVLLPILRGVWDFISKHLIPGISSILGPVLEGLSEAWKRISEKIKENKDLFETLGAVLTTVGAFITDTVAPIVGKVLGGAFKVVGVIIGGIIDVIAFLVKAIKGIVDAVKWIAEPFKKGFEIVRNIVKGVLNFIIDAINIVIGAINKIQFTVPDFPGVPHGGETFGINLDLIPHMAKGGIVSRPTLALIGENGPEAVVPLGRGGMGGGGIHIHVAGSVVTERDLAVAVRDNIAQLMRRRGLDPAILGV